MKKTTLLFILFLGFINWSYGQCTNQDFQWPSFTVNISNAPGVQSIAIDNYADNEFSILTGIIPGETYTVTAAMYITVTESDATTVITHGANSVTFTAGTGVTSIYCFWTVNGICTGGGNTDIATNIECSTCTCTATSAPNAATTPTPINGATNIPIDSTDPTDLLITPFEWVDATSGDLADSYNLTLGITTSGADLGTITGATSGNGITYDWEYNTTYYWKVDAVNCFGTTTGTVWSFTTTSCTDSAPVAAITPTPANGAIDVAIDTTDPTELLITPFLWADDTAGGAASSYSLSLGTTTSGNDIGTIDPVDNGDGVIYDWEYDTTYYWYIESTNCAGTSTGTVWSFTTEADPNLSVEQFNKTKFSLYPNPANDVIRIKSDAILDTVEIYNQVGQRVINLNSESIIDKSIEINNLNTGIYFMTITAGSQEQTIKFIKK
ncbi:T9SS C-terminal target domain-containing protein [Olleya aquimaris]|nr:T9SS C-terminal target domain-containing protein [Olleya aquimaris]